MKQMKWFTLLCAGLFLFSGCSEDENENPVSSFGAGALIVNEGNFGQSDGSLSFYHTRSDSVTEDVIKKQNGGENLGATLISAYEHDGLIYLISNSPDKIEIVSVDDFTFEGAPLAGPDFVAPRYMTVTNGKAYVTCWGDWDENFTLPDSYVAVIDLSQRTVIEKIRVQDGAEGIFAVGDKVFVANSYTNWVTVIDSDTDEKMDSLQTAYDAPNDFVLDKNKKLWVVCKGPWGGEGGLVRINSDGMEADFEAVTTGLSPIGKIAINGEGDRIYFLTGAGVHSHPVNSEDLDLDPLISGGDFYAIGYHPGENALYVADPKGFQTAGRVERYNPDGTMINGFDAAVGPSSFLFY